MLTALRRLAGTWVAKILFALLVLSFAVWGIEDVVRNFGRETAVATVGGTPTALHRAIAAAGGTQTAQARALGLSQAHVWNWLRAGRVPAERVLAIYRATGGEVTPHALRPDIYPDPEYRPRLETPSGSQVPSAREAGT